SPERRSSSTSRIDALSMSAGRELVVLAGVHGPRDPGSDEDRQRADLEDGVARLGPRDERGAHSRSVGGEPEVCLRIERSEERRVGKECRYRWSPSQSKKKKW